ncbi:hypothetical protein, variant 2 [Aphanomyces astaci]|uniref:BK channel n=1 Tax=Aphanomyces astaci TaxID=112090 RepID=W4H2V7_APHAT|nr:hypothetical protein, variant 2 [Aphanomyces astaci]ETV86365.1 hypothetical protein, variant 2 [Aphanomyces astaci]|eukprot:XP_009824836.1 hypothetical protein, variant 2 [Aphanomyces astaci]
MAPSRQATASPLRYHKQNGRVFVSDRQKLTERSRLSSILLGNEHWDLFHGIPKGFTLRTRVRIKLETSHVGYAWDMFQTLVSLVACAVCVVQSYHDEFVVPSMDLSFGVIFAADYCLRFYCAKNRLWFPFTFSAIIDVLAVAPTIYDYVTNDSTGQRPTFAFLRFVRILRIMKAIQMSRHSSANHFTAVQQQLLSLGLLVTSIVFISACLFQLVENSYRVPILSDTGAWINNNVTLGDSFYFILVTISTVGYGDIAYVRPTNIYLLYCGFRLLLHRLKFTTIRDLIGFHKNDMDLWCRLLLHRLVYITINRNGIRNLDCGEILEICITDSTIYIYILEWNKVMYIKGSILNDEDLHRVAVDTAQAAFLLADKNSNDSVAEDANTVLRSLVLENYNPDLQIFMQVISPSYTDFITHNDLHHILCIDQHKLSLLAKNCLCPGLSTLVCNLFRSTVLPDTLSHIEWKREYVEGSTMEIYTTATPSYMVDLSFTKAADMLYDIFDGEVILVGIHEGKGGASSKSATASSSSTLSHMWKGMSSTFLSERSPAKNPSRTQTHQHNPAPCCLHPRPWEQLAPHCTTYVNPGANYMLQPHHILYVLCESRNVAQLVSCPEYYSAWVRRGHHHVTPVPPSTTTTTSSTSTHQARYAQPYDLLQANSRLVSTRIPLSRKRNDVVIAAVSSDEEEEESGRGSIRDHIIVVSDLVDVPIETFIKPLRLAHYTDGSTHYRPIVFVSTCDTAIQVAYDVARHYHGVYLMQVANDSKETFFKAGIMNAKCCVLLAEKSGQRVMDGESLDNRVIFRYLTVQKILEKHSAAMSPDFAVFVEMAASRYILVAVLGFPLSQICIYVLPVAP